MGNNNSFLKNGIKINNLSDKEKELINKIPHTDYTYICKYCKKIPRIEIVYNEEKENEKNIFFEKNFLTNKKYIVKIKFKECKHSITLNGFDNYDDYNEADFLGLIKVSLDKLREENFMNVNKRKNVINKEEYLNFDNINDFNEYLNVYKSFLNIKDKIKEYNLDDTKNNKIFTLFENLLYIGLNGLGTKFEFENSIAIKEFTFDKFICYNKEFPVNDNLHFINIRNIVFKISIEVYNINNELYALEPSHNLEYKYTKIYIVKYDQFLNKSFNIDEYIQYCRSDCAVPKELKKYFLNLPQIWLLSINNIIALEENAYIIRIYNELFKYVFDEIKNEYLIEKIRLENEEDEDDGLQELISLKNNIIFIITIKYIYFYSYNKENKTLNYAKKFNNMLGKKSHPKDILHIIDLNNGKTLFYYYSSILIISLVTQQIQTFVKFDSNGYIHRINDKLLKFKDYSSFSSRKSYYLDIYKSKIFKKESKYDEFNIDGQFLNNDIIISEGLNCIKIKDRKTKNIEYINMGILNIFIFNKEENLFGLYIYDNKKYKLLIYKKK